MKKILVVDDSALMRRVIFDIINKDRNLHVEKYATNGLDALDLLVSGEKFDAIVLDINMPKMNGIEFLRELKKRGMNEKVLIVSTLAKEGAKETIQALELGAFDFVTKPDSLAIAKGNLFSNMLLDMLYAAVNLSRRTLDNEVKQQAKDHSSIRKTHSIYGKALQGDTSKHSKKPLCGTARKLVALACSTGGPKALQYVVPFLPANLDAAVLIVQHMPEGFTASLSNRLDELSRIKVKEAAHGDILEKGTVYLAKGGSQMRLIEKGRMQDIMYESLVGSSFDEITCVVMTGMGADGTKGIIQLEQKNKIYVIAQDEESSTVYGMPKAIADAKAVDEVVTLRKIADAITKHVGVR